MKNMMLCVIICGILSIKSMHAMDPQTLINGATAALSTVVTAASRGLNNMYYGHTDILIDAITKNQVNADQITRDHQLDWSVSEQLKARNMEKLCRLLTLVDTHNTRSPLLAIHMSPTIEAQTRQPLQDHYAKLAAALTQSTETLMTAMILRWRAEHQELTALTFVEEDRLQSVTRTIAFVQGVTPNNATLSTQLADLLVTTRYRNIPTHPISTSNNNNNNNNNITIQNNVGVPIETDFDIISTNNINTPVATAPAAISNSSKDDDDQPKVVIIDHTNGGTASDQHSSPMMRNSASSLSLSSTATNTLSDTDDEPSNSSRRSSNTSPITAASLLDVAIVTGAGKSDNNNNAATSSNNGSGSASKKKNKHNNNNK